MSVKIKNYEDYEITSEGEVISHKLTTPKILKPRVREVYKYKYINLCKNGKVKTYFIHRLVATHFVKNPKNKPQVNHIDGNSLNNNYKNLEWCTSSENVQHASRLGLLNIKKGEESNLSKLTKKEVLEIRSKYIPKINTYSKLAKEYGVTKIAILDIIKRRTWKHI